ncbi:GDP-mannose 4,6-dehydratase [Desulfitobacterium sp. PCE1]|uniref:GDP-mannose 4,6-dehydratase n=1 Tax=Desulfitobacterium sp. PCE1 TaxID=146907 RepID=UPI0003763A36|nr:GDP-mannose 4,6-dehydratase [Desulfitobacterium sp. PCE1]
MKALITGINGFVGGYLAERLLRDGIEVWGTDLNEELSHKSYDIKYRKLDIIEASAVETVLNQCRPDYIFHLAAQSSAAVSWKNPQMTMDVNINGTINLLESVRKLRDEKAIGDNQEYEPRILLIGSSEEYGFVEQRDMPIKEEQAIVPGNPYAVSKIAQTLLGQVYARAYDLQIVVVRAFNHIGPQQSPIFVVSDFTKRIAEIEKGQREPVLLVGNLEAERDFTDVRDIVEAYCSLIEKGKAGEIYNVGSGRVYRVQYLLDYLLSCSQVSVKIQQDPARMRPSDVPVISCDNRKLQELTGWFPKHKIEDTLREVLEYWRQEIG